MVVVFRGVILAVIFVGTLSQSEELRPTYFLGREVYSDVDTFLGGKKLYHQEYRGVTPSGQECSFSITQTRGRIIFTPQTSVKSGGTDLAQLARGKTFVIPRFPLVDIDGGFAGDSLWASYFIDKPGSKLHGQYGISFHLDLRKNATGDLIQMRFLKSKHDDLNYQRLGELDCLFPPAINN